MLFDYASPYAFLANETLAQRLPGIDVDLVPVYLRGFDSFKSGIPYSAQKLAWIVQDLRRTAEELAIPFRVPVMFPVNGLYALRGAIAAQRAGKLVAYHTPMFRAVWQDARDVASKDAVASIARELGLPEVAEALDEPAVKDALKANTEAARARGAFGVPTFFVANRPTEIFWGHDRMHHVAAALHRSS